MTHDECFVYKVPPLATASGYKANDWNLANPIETCGFQIERRNNSLYLLFTLHNHTKLFALSCIDASQPITRSVEPVTDSSRYFVCQIMQPGQQQAASAASGSGGASKPKTALLGFGFRDRDVAVDLLGNLQQFTRSIEREREAKNMKVASIPTLEKGEKIHIEIKGMKHRHSHDKTSMSSSPSKSAGGGPFLLKKPPPGSHATSAPAVSPAGVPAAAASDDTPPVSNDAHEDDDDFGDFQGA